MTAVGHLSPTLTVKVVPNLPARLRGGTAIGVVVQGFDYRVNLDVAKLPELSSGTAAGKYVPVWDSVAGVYQRIEFTRLPPPSTSWESISGKPEAFLPEDHEHEVLEISDSGVTGRAVVQAAQPADARAAIGAISADDLARVLVQRGGAPIGQRRALNFLDGPNVTTTITDDAAGERVDIRIEASGGGSGGGIPEAPSNATLHGRRGEDTSWQPVLALSGGTLSGALTLAGPPTEGLHAATRDYADLKQAVSQKGAANGYASLGADGKVPAAQLPPVGSVTITDNIAGIASPSVGNLAWESDTGRMFIYYDSFWVQVALGGGA